MCYALHQTNNCPAPLDSEHLCKFQFSELLDTAPIASPGGEAAPVRTLGLKRNAGENVGLMPLYILFPALQISPFLFRPRFARPPSPREKVCGFAANSALNINLNFPCFRRISFKRTGNNLSDDGARRAGESRKNLNGNPMLPGQFHAAIMENLGAVSDEFQHFFVR